MKQSLSLFSLRYALICQQCFSHNGMALKEEFEYLGENRNTPLHLLWTILIKKGLKWSF